MTPQQQLGTLFGGIACVLIVATSIGQILGRRLASGRPNPTIDNLNARIVAWWGMVALMGVAFLFGKPGMIISFALVSFAGLREFITLVPTRRGDHWALLSAFLLILPLQYIIIWFEWNSLYTLFIPVCVFLLMPILVAIRGETKQFLERVADMQWGLMICVFCMSHVPALLMLSIHGYAGRNLLLVAFLVIVVQASDVLQYVWGQFLGRRKIAPRLSPSKTVEGFVGGCVSATLLGASLWWITPFEPWLAALIAAAITSMGFFGGLVMSAVKRDRGVKDWGSMIYGHGGVLDRFDSIIFSAPLFFYFLRYWSAIR